MRSLLKAAFITVIGLYLVDLALPGLTVIGGPWSYLNAGLVLTLMNLVVRPVLSLLLLPVNLMTLGMFRWLVNVATLSLTSLVVDHLTITAATLPGINYVGFVTPELHLSAFWITTLGAFLLSLTTSTLDWLTK